MRRGGLEGETPKHVEMAEDFDDIATLVNLLELRSRLRIGHFENELD